MAIPEQVRKQTEAVAALYKELSPEAEEASSVKDEAGAATDEGNVQTLPVADVDVTPAPDAIPATNELNVSQDETFEQKFRTLQGMYETDWPRMNAENQSLTQKVGQLEQLIATMQVTPSLAPEAAPVPVSSLTNDEVEEYGESIDIMRKVSQEVTGPFSQQLVDLQTSMRDLQAAVVPRVEQIAHQQTVSAEQIFWNDLTSAVPKWRAINDHKDFQSWLLEVDPLTGQTRQFFLDDAQRNMDIIRVVSFFTSWLRTQGTSRVEPNPATLASELERQVAPGRSRSTAAPDGSTAPTYTPGDISKFFDDVRSGKYAGKEEERNRFERDIFAAQREGRIVNA